MRKSKKKKLEMKYNILSSLFAEGRPAVLPRILFSFLLILVLSSALVLGCLFCFYKTPLFKITNVNIIDPMNAIDINRGALSARLRAENIFEVDIGFLGRLIREEHPEVKKIIVRRILPNSIAIEVIPRVPIVKIKELKYFPVDENGVVLSPDMKTGGHLPIVTGYHAWSALKVGERLDSRQVRLALELVKYFQKATNEFDISTINMGSFNNMTFVVEGGPQVKIGKESYPERIARLLKFLSNPKIDGKNIAYIDLRFENIIVKPK